MKRNVAFLILICTLLLVGCTTKQVVEPGILTPAPVEEQTEPVEVEIRELQAPERDPFATGSVSESGSEVVVSAVEAEGRNPFVVADGSDRERLAGEVESGGRNPFAVVPNEVIVPEIPVEPEEPVDPGEIPVDPEPGEPNITDGVQLRIVTTERCWLDIFEDGVRVLRDNVPGGRTLDFYGDSEVRLEQVGREQAVSVTVNGKDLGRLLELVQRLENGPYEDREAGVRVSLERRYPGGVLVGLRFTALNGDN
ncbi:MAG: hypothetical protein KGZ63_03610 [Clostridiales bacterium]|nr:hypothetical protein [Clostridiales bacterium]